MFKLLTLVFISKLSFPSSFVFSTLILIRSLNASLHSYRSFLPLIPLHGPFILYVYSFAPTRSIVQSNPTRAHFTCKCVNVMQRLLLQSIKSNITHNVNVFYATIKISQKQHLVWLCMMNVCETLSMFTLSWDWDIFVIFGGGLNPIQSTNNIFHTPQ